MLDALFDTPGLGLAELSETTGLHTNTLRDHLRVLEDQGFVRADVEHTGARGRPRSIYFAVEADETNEVAERRIRQARTQGDLLRRLVPSSVGSLDDDAVHQLDALYQHLDDLGLEPDIDEPSLTVTMVPCTFHTLIDNNRDAMCNVHEHLIRTLLAQAGGPIDLTTVTPFATPHTCRLQLELRKAARPTAPSDGHIDHSVEEPQPSE